MVEGCSQGSVNFLALPHCGWPGQQAGRLSQPEKALGKVMQMLTAAGWHQKLEVEHSSLCASQVALAVKNPPASAGDIRDVGSIPGLGRSPGGGHGNPPQYSCLENPMDRGAWWAMVHRVAKTWT